jgi:hypothetical protein
MLRLCVLLLLLANAGYYAWSQGLLAAWGTAPAQQSEPQRLEQQINPGAVRLLGADEVSQLQSGPRLAECFQAGPFDEAETPALRQALGTLPAGSWSLEPAVEPARWIVYMGKYPDAETVARKRAELRRLAVSFDAVSNPALEPGLSLGGFATQAAAAQQLEVLAQKGVQTAKVVQERAELRGQLLKLAAVDDALRPRVEDIKPALNGKALRSCR